MQAPTHRGHEEGPMLGHVRVVIPLSPGLVHAVQGVGPPAHHNRNKRLQGRGVVENNNNARQQQLPHQLLQVGGSRGGGGGGEELNTAGTPTHTIALRNNSHVRLGLNLQCPRTARGRTSTSQQYAVAPYSSYRNPNLARLATAAGEAPKRSRRRRYSRRRIVRGRPTMYTAPTAMAYTAIPNQRPE